MTRLIDFVLDLNVIHKIHLPHTDFPMVVVRVLTIQHAAVIGNMQVQSK